MAQHLPFLGTGAAGTTVNAQQHPVAQEYHTTINSQDQDLLLQTPQASFSRNAQLPGVDLSALAGISPEQLAAIARLFQSGALPLPPSSQSQVFPSSDSNVVSRSSPMQVGDASATRNQSVDMEKEDGEIDDGDKVDTPNDRAFLRPPPTGPKGRSRSPQSLAGQFGLQRDPHSISRPSAYSTGLSASNTTQGVDGRISKVVPSGPRVPKAHRHSHSPSPVEITSTDAASRAFVMEMHRAGYTYGQLAQGLNNPAPLHRMFQQLGLPILETSSVTRTERQPETGSAPPMGRQASISKRVPSKTAAPKDRSEYLAKLQAAKNKKTEASTPPTSTQVPSGTASPQPNTLPLAPNKSQPSGRANPVARANTELIRQRLEALKAEQAAKQSALIASNMQAVSTDLHSSIIANQPNAALRNASSKSSSAVESNTGGSNGSLPGLLVSSTSPQSPAPQPAGQLLAPTLANTSTSNSLPPISSTTVSRKRGVASDFFDDAPLSPSSALPKRPFGQDTYGSNAESMIITVSEDEDDNDDDGDDDDDDEGDAMDIDESSDDDSVSGQQQAGNQGPWNADARSQQSLAQSSISSTPGTPLARPSASALERTEQELINLRKALADAKLRRAAGRVEPRPVSEAPQPTEWSATVTSTSANSQENGNMAIDEVASNKPMTREAEKERLRRRLQELQKARGLNGSPSMKSSGNQPAPTLVGSNIGKESAASAIGQKEDQISDYSLGANGRGGSRPLSPPRADADTNSGERHGTEPEIRTPEQEQKSGISGDEASVPVLDSNKPLDETNPEQIVLPTLTTRDSQSKPEELRPSETSALSGVAVAQSDGTHSENHDDDDLDDVYEQPVAGKPAASSLTSTIPKEAAAKESDDEMEISANSSVEDDDDDDDLYEPKTIPASFQADLQVGSKSVPSIQNDVRLTSDDLAPELQPVDAQTSKSTGNESEITLEMTGQNPDASDPEIGTHAAWLSRPRTYFQQYESPLTIFHDYRYHPEFSSTVSGGFKSLTYSNKIDADTALCPFEAAGGKCNDNSCSFQHFSNMIISDNDLIRVMGTENVPAETEEENRKWKEGLSAVVRQLRSTNLGRDVQAIAQRIADFRRDFVGNSTKILHLD